LITTVQKAKELRPFAERAITLGKRALAAEVPEAALHKRRLAAGYFFSGNANRVPDGGYKRPHAPRTAGVAALEKLFGEVASRYAERPGGYTRILKLGARRGDGAEMALIELIGSEIKEAHSEEKKDEKKKGRRLFGRRKKEGGSDAKETSDQKPAAKAAKRAASGKSGSKSSKKRDSDAGGSKPKTRRGKKDDSE